MELPIHTIAACFVAPPATADGDPFSDLGLLAAEGGKWDLIMRAGDIIKNRLN